MNKLLANLAVLISLLTLSGCGSTLKVAEIDSKTGYFATTHKVSHGGIVVNTKYNENKYSPMLYVKTDEKGKQYNTFFIDTFTKTKKFNKVVGKADLEKLVFEKGLASKVTSVSDVIGLHSLHKEIGDFLVVEPYVEWKGGYNFEAELKALDPESGKVVYHVKNKAFNWDGLDQPLFFPMFNAFLDWTEGRTTQTEPKPEEKAEN